MTIPHHDHTLQRKSARYIIAASALVFMAGIAVILVGYHMTGGYVMIAGGIGMLVGGVLLNRTNPVGDDDVSG